MHTSTCVLVLRIRMQVVYVSYRLKLIHEYKLTYLRLMINMTLRM